MWPAIVVATLAVAVGTSAIGPAPAAVGAPAPKVPRYAAAGPYAAAVTTLDLPDRKVEVWYPARPRAVRGKTRDTYDLLTKVPSSVAALLPAGANVQFQTDAYRDVPAATKRGGFPLVLMVHGQSGYREMMSYLASHLASWGFVVASPDMLEHSLAATLGSPPATTRNDVDVMADTVALVRAQNDQAGGALTGRVKAGKLALVGQAVGGNSVIKYASQPGVVAYIPISASGFNTDAEQALPLPNVPSLWVTGADDHVVPVANVEAGYQRAATPARFAAITGAGHTSLTDVCPIGGPGGIVGLAQRANLPIPDDIQRLAADGCANPPANPDPAWAVVDHLVTAQLRLAFRLDRNPVGLDAKTMAGFAPESVRYEERLP